MKHLTTVCFLVAALLDTMVPALAVPPVFNGDVITRTLPTFNIKSYGAKVDGSTDDSTAVNAAESACNTAGGGVVFFPAGTTKASGITFYTGCYQVGAGFGVSVVSPPNSVNTTVFTSYQFATLTGTNSTGGVYHTGFIDLTIDGNKANESGGACAKIYGSLLTFENVQFQNCWGDGLYSEWSSSSNGAQDYNTMEASLSNVRFTNNGNNGVTWKGPHDSIWSNIITAENAVYGAYIGGNGEGVLATNFHSWGASQQWGLYIDNGMGSNFFTNAVVEGASSGQVYIGGNQNAFNGTIYAPGASAVGLRLGSVGHGVASNSINAVIFSSTNATGAVVDFGADNGVNTLNLTTYCPTASTPLYTGVYAGTDTILWTTNSCTGTPPNAIAVGDGAFTTGPHTVQGQLTVNGALAAGTNNISGGSYIFAGGGYGIGITGTTSGPINIFTNGMSNGKTATITSGGAWQALAHNACGSSSGWSCEASGTCSISAGTTCSFTVTAPAGSVCSASANASDTTTGVESWNLSLSTNTLTVKATVASSQTSTAAANVTCL